MVGARYAAEAALHLKGAVCGSGADLALVRRYCFAGYDEPGTARLEPQLHALLADTKAIVAKDAPNAKGGKEAGKDACQCRRRGEICQWWREAPAVERWWHR